MQLQLLRALFSAHIGGGANKFARSSVCRKRTINHNIANLVKHKLANRPAEASHLKHGESTTGLIFLSRGKSTLIGNNWESYKSTNYSDNDKSVILETIHDISLRPWDSETLIKVRLLRAPPSRVKRSSQRAGLSRSGDASEKRWSAAASLSSDCHQTWQLCSTNSLQRLSSLLALIGSEWSSVLMQVCTNWWVEQFSESNAQQIWNQMHIEFDFFLRWRFSLTKT